MPGARSVGSSAFTTGKKPTSAAVASCVAGFVMCSITATAPARFGASFGMARPAITGM